MQVVKSYPNNMFCWVDLATSDVPAAKEFFTGLFGWDYFDIPTDMGSNYSLCQIDGYNICGLSNLPPEMMAQNIPPVWSSYINHENVDADGCHGIGTPSRTPGPDRRHDQPVAAKGTHRRTAG